MDTHHVSDSLERLRAALTGRYDVQREIGHGGMAVVYLARDLRHDRPVAIKVLHPDLAAAVGADRFLREIAIAAQLQHPHVLTLIDSGTADGLLYYVMPFVDGHSLRDRLAGAPQGVPISEATRILGEVTDALAHAHRHGVVHRDIKPDNVMLADGHAQVVDFGVAKAMRDSSATHQLTSIGISLGTPAYMAPEQAAADPAADHRVDVYALGVLGYELLTGRTPFSGSPQAVLAAQIAQRPEPVRSLRPEVPPALATIVMKCLEKSPADRFQTAAELGAALDALITPSGGTTSALRTLAENPRRRWQAAAVAVVLLASVAWMGTSALSRSRKERWVHATAIPQIQRLAELSKTDSAWTIARRADALLPNDSALASLWPKISGKVVLQIEPAGAMVHRTFYRDSTGWELVTAASSGDSVRVPIAFSRYRIEKPGYRPLYFAASATGLLGSALGGFNRPFVLDRIDAPDSDMIRIPGAKSASALVVGLDHVAPVALGDFLIDRHEVTNAQYRAFVNAGGYTRRELWTEPFVHDGRAIPWEEGIKLLVDGTGRPGPATWEGGSPPAGQESFPVGGVSWYEAAAYAKFVGKQLPTVFHWVHAASVFGGQWIIPGSNVQAQGPARGSSFAGMSPSGAFDMAGNVREWCVNAAGDKRYLLGGGWSDEPYAFNDAYSEEPFRRTPTNGFRLMKANDTEPALAAASRPLEVAQRDFAKEKPVGDPVFDSYRRMYDYDASPLAAKAESRDTSNADWVIERVSYTAAYGGERIPAVLFLPKRHPAPYQTVVLFPGSNALHSRSSKDVTERTRILDFIVRSGRAVLYPIYKSTYERGDSLDSDYANQSVFYRDHVVMWAKDVRRSVDYLASRSDVDTARIAYYGGSWGSYLAPMNLALEPRFKVAVLYVAGLEMERAKDEAEPINFLPRVKLPVLMLNGRYDFFFPIETSQKPFFQMLGTSADRKRWVVYDGGHNVPREQLISETLDWLDKYLGKPH
jgi:serine/threonine protein kinase/dienelactone hydrolase